MTVVDAAASLHLAEVGTARKIERRSRRSVFRAFLDAANMKGAGEHVLTDGDGKKFSYRDLSRAAFALSGPIARTANDDQTLGVLLPTGAGVVIAIFALHASGRTPAMLNFTAGAANLKAACKAAQVTKVLTAHKFIEIANLSGLVADLGETVEFVYLEELREELTALDKAKAVLGPIFPTFLAAKPNADEAGVILFTSGTEGSPKGVVLSHANIIANIEQISEHVELLPTDIFFNPLPAFHCYGLTAGTLWPLISGHQAVLHPSPLQTKIIPKRIFETGSTVLFATDTFLQQYMRASADGGMSSLRLAVCGAERVREETRQTAEKRFGLEVLEGYGVTECSPVLAANQPGDIRAGTIGKMLPAVDYRIDPVEGLSDAGRLVVRGPNVMKGYISADKPGEIQPLAGGWHDTGDVVSVDKQGYITIRGRMKRFAKIGGEMVSLTVVENCASAVWPGNLHAAAIAPDPRKGEQIVLVTDKTQADRAMLLTWAQTHGVPEIAVPKKIFSIEEMPVLGTGKLDYVRITAIAKEALAETRAEKLTAAPAPALADDTARARKARKKQDAERRAEARKLAREAKKRAKDAASAAKDHAKSGGGAAGHSHPAPASPNSAPPDPSQADQPPAAKTLEINAKSAGPRPQPPDDITKKAAE